ncbi:MAG: LuxR family transcriptional regulator [Mesorhizobium sp.]|uniref:LuxR family transcriptional regulator n=3 Tax=Mesorhizobium sp. TaxID=1871066 RepID=UPI00120FD0E8|nr:LuxR family transcriptional regulator [Mesorhizobium sp.]TIS53912.1 MAG: LuxR family transcriptional regulator [Mesorhizobium sp.]TJW07004.1 MAG: LuxR family transcriptional regulator [Mesorhizobium sp.]
MERATHLLDLVRNAGDTANAVEAVRKAFDVHVTYHLAQTAAGNVDAPFVRTTYPAAWVARYLLAGYVKVDPIAREGFGRILPFDWSEVEIGAEAMPMMRDALEHGLGSSGYSVPIIDRHGRRALFSINGTTTGDDWQAFVGANQASLAEIGHAIHRVALRELYGNDEPPQLSAREREVLMWTARGKDYKAVGLILGISHHTTKAYLKSARYKLDCTTIAQAVAKALSLRLISE